MATSHGSKAVFTVQDSGSVVRDLSAYLTSAGMPRSADTADVSTLGSLSKSYIPGLKDGTIPIEGPFDVTVDGYLSGILGYASRAFVYKPQGTGATLPQYAGNCILTSYEVSTPVGDAATFSGEFQITGDVTRTVQ